MGDDNVVEFPSSSAGAGDCELHAELVEESGVQCAEFRLMAGNRLCFSIRVPTSRLRDIRWLLQNLENHAMENPRP